MTTNARKLEAVETTLTILKPRLTEPWINDVKLCIDLIKEVREDLSNGEDDSAGDGGQDQPPSEQSGEA